MLKLKCNVHTRFDPSRSKTQPKDCYSCTAIKEAYEVFKKFSEVPSQTGGPEPPAEV